MCKLLAFILFFIVPVLCTGQNKSANILPIDSSTVKITKIFGSNNAEDILNRILSPNFDVLLIGEQHKWKDNFSFYNDILKTDEDLHKDKNTKVFFEFSVIFQKPIDDYIRTKDSAGFRKKMMYANTGIDKFLMNNFINFCILSLPMYSPNYQFNCIDQYAGVDGYLKGCNLILSEYRKNSLVAKKINLNNRLLKKLKGSGRYNDSLRKIAYQSVSDTISVFKTLNEHDKGLYKAIAYAFTKVNDHQPNFFEIEFIRERFLIETFLSKTDSLKQRGIFFCGANHASYTKYVDTYSGKKPQIPFIGKYLKQDFPDSKIMNICFDVVNKQEIKFSNPSLNFVSNAKALTNRFWQKLTASDTLQEFNLYTCNSYLPQIPFNFIILKKNGIDLYDNEEYLSGKFN